MYHVTTGIVIHFFFWKKVTPSWKMHCWGDKLCAKAKQIRPMCCSGINHAAAIETVTLIFNGVHNIYVSFLACKHWVHLCFVSFWGALVCCSFPQFFWCPFFYNQTIFLLYNGWILRRNIVKVHAQRQRVFLLASLRIGNTFIVVVVIWKLT